MILVQGGSANGATAQQVVSSFVQAKFADARAAYQISNAEVGYTPGYGAVSTCSRSRRPERRRTIGWSCWPRSRTTPTCSWPDSGGYQEFAQGGLTDGHPSGVATAVALFMDPINNSVLWKGDAPR